MQAIKSNKTMQAIKSNKNWQIWKENKIQRTHTGVAVGELQNPEQPSQGFRSDEGTNHCTVSDSHLSGTGTGHTQSSIRKALKTELMLEKNSEIGLPG